MAIGQTENKKRVKPLSLTLLFYYRYLVRPERFERPTPWFVAKYSIQLSYGRMRSIIL